MHKCIIVALTVVVCAAICLAPSRADTQELIRERLKSDVGIELLGKAVIYSFYYQYTVNRLLGLEAGLGALGGGSAEDNATVRSSRSARSSISFRRTARFFSPAASRS
jgi:hypothetical protein